MQNLPSPQPQADLSTAFQVESSHSGDTIMVHAPTALTMLVRGHVARRLAEAARVRGIPITRLLEEAITYYLDSEPPQSGAS
jgi:hypothetical protein